MIQGAKSKTSGRSKPRKDYTLNEKPGKSSLQLPEKRTDILYSRITSRNKKFLVEYADSLEVSESVLINHILDCFVENNAGNPKKPRRNA